MRIDDLLQNRRQYETGGWLLIVYPGGECDITSQRIGRKHFRNQAEAEAFVSEYYQGLNGFPQGQPAPLKIEYA